MTSRAPTLQTIADVCGVSRMTVSLALRRHLSIPRPTRERVERAAARLGYRPNPMVSALMAQLRGTRAARYQATVAVVHDAERVEWRTMFPAARAMAAGLQARGDELGYRLETFWLRDPRWRNGRLERALRQRGVFGVVVAPLPTGRERIAFDFSCFAAAAIGLSLREPELPCASSHHFQAVQLVHGKLVAAGRRRIGLSLQAHQDERARHQWLGAYLACEAAAGRRAAAVGPGARTELLSWAKSERLDAIMSLEPADLSRLREGGVEVPARIAFACLTLPPGQRGIAGARSNAAGIGAAALDLVVAQLNRNERGVPEEARVVLIPTRWVEGPTIGEGLDGMLAGGEISRSPT